MGAYPVTVATSWFRRAGDWRSGQTGTTTITTPTAFRGIDATAYIPEQSWFNDRFADGFRLYCLHSTEWGGTAPWWRTKAQLAMALEAGLKVGVYTRDPRTWYAGIAACGPYIKRLQFFAIDVESDGPFGDPGQPATREMVAGVQALGIRPVIYSGYNMWPDVMGASTEFADVPLWDTDTSAPPTLPGWTADLSTPTAVGYGGWNTTGNPRVIVQQAFNVTIDGIIVDLNSVSPAFLLDK